MINLKFTKSGIKIKDAEFNSNKSKVKFFLNNHQLGIY
jgi:hypothetical protein